MMNNQFNTSNLPNHHQHGIQHPTAATVLNNYLSVQQQQPLHQQQVHPHLAVTANSLYADPRQLHMTAHVNPLEKTYFTATSTQIPSTPPRFYNSAAAFPTANTLPNSQNVAGHINGNHHHQNTILITNNFAQQAQLQQNTEPQQRSTALNAANIRIIPSSSVHAGHQMGAAAVAATSAAGPLYHPHQHHQHASQHVFNLNNNKALQHLFPQHLLQQHNFQPAPHPPATELMQQFAPAQHFATSPPTSNSLNQHHQQHLQQNSATLQLPPQYFVAAENAGITQQINSNSKHLSGLTSTNANNNSSSPPSSLIASNSPPNGSTVVLDRINICINNLYTDTSSSTTSSSNSLTSTPAQQPSPIIPAIQHKAVIETCPPLSMSTDYESNILVIDEPDSTTTATTPHTPPTTPENTPSSISGGGGAGNHAGISTTTTIYGGGGSPSTSQPDRSSFTITTTKPNFASVAKEIEDAAEHEFETTQNPYNNSNSTTTPLTPPSPEAPLTVNLQQQESQKSPTLQIKQQQQQQHQKQQAKPSLFANGEDVFIKRQDERFYLGTVIDAISDRFLVQFDDKSEQWCSPEEMRKLGSSSSAATDNGTASSTASPTKDSSVVQPMCVACKRLEPESKVEICERCGRGYHRKCTVETAPGSNVWLCKRCTKPMKLNTVRSRIDSVEMSYSQLSYDIESLTWDAKHRVNDEQIYCYCAKSGKFDHNMLQCCRCLNWYHTQCTQKHKGNLMRGDGFFVFSCSICNHGEEYLRRLQLNWIDLVHLILYNLSTLKKHQHHKYHHLIKDIIPFVTDKRSTLPISNEWLAMEQDTFIEQIKSTLQNNPEHFICGREIKRDHYLFALRVTGPPVIPRIPINSDDILNDELILNKLKLKLLKEAPENSDIQQQKREDDDGDCHVIVDTLKSKPKEHNNTNNQDVYEFDDTSEDELPIKHILEKVKQTKAEEKSTVALVVREEQVLETTNQITKLNEMDVEDDNANDLILNLRVEETEDEEEEDDEGLVEKLRKEEQIKEDDTSATIINTTASSTSLDENQSTVLKLKDTANATATIISSDIIKKEKSSRKRKAFSLTGASAAKQQQQRLLDLSSDENSSSSSSRGTSLDFIIPPPKNFHGQNNPFRMLTTPQKKKQQTTEGGSGSKKSVSFGIFNTTTLNFSSKLAALKSAGLFPNMSSSNLAKAAGQPRTVRTIKRRLSAKDITIGPNQEVRRRRIRRLSSHVEVISTTTINPIPTNYFPIHAKDLLTAAAATTTSPASLFPSQNKTVTTTASQPTSTSPTAAAAAAVISTQTKEVKPPPPLPSSILPAHGRRLRQRPPKISPANSRRSSVSSNQSTTSSSTASTSAAATAAAPLQAPTIRNDLKQTVNKYFGIVNRIESGEQFSIRAKRLLSNGRMQYLIEWGGGSNNTNYTIEQQSQNDNCTNIAAATVAANSSCNVLNHEETEISKENEQAIDNSRQQQLEDKSREEQIIEKDIIKQTVKRKDQNVLTEIH